MNVSRSAVFRIVFGLIVLCWHPHPASANSALAGVKSWAAQLVAANPAEIAQSNLDMIVVDYGSLGKSDDSAAFASKLDQLRRTPTGGRRIVLAYFSIGEAESYRSYWQENWLVNRPDWLGAENPNWPNNYAVRYWQPEWQALLFGNPNTYLDQVLAAGFDGVFLDGVDQYETWQEQRPAAKTDMINFVARIAGYGRERHAGFLVVPQNADELLEDKSYLQLIDGLSREELLYGEDAPEARNSKDSIAASLKNLQRLRRAGKPVFVIEYVQQPQLAASALQELEKLGFIGYIATRGLNTLTLPASGCAPPDCSQ